MMRFTVVSKYPRHEYVVEGVANAIFVWRSFGTGGATPPIVSARRLAYTVFWN